MFTKPKIKKCNLGGLIGALVGIYLIYYLLLQDELLPFSINSILSRMIHWDKYSHVLAVGLIPIYVALMIFGAGIMGLYSGSCLYNWIKKILQKYTL